MAFCGLLRFSDYKYSMDSSENQYLFYNKIENFKTKQSRDTFHFREDYYENVDKIFQPEDITKFVFAGREFKIADNAPPMALTLGGYDYFTHICSFLMLEIDEHRVYVEGDTIFDEQLFDFGDSYIFISYKTLELLYEDLNTACREQGIIKWQADKVEYVDINSYSGDWGPFKKDIKYQYQNEFRIVIQSNSDEPVKLKLKNYKKIIFGPITKEDSINQILNGKAVLV